MSTSNRVRLKIKSKPTTTTDTVQPVAQAVPNGATAETPVETAAKQTDENKTVEPEQNQVKVKSEPITIDDTTESKQPDTTQQPVQPVLHNNTPHTTPSTNLNDNRDVTTRGKKRPSSVLDYIIQLGGDTLNNLYTDTFTTLTIFRSLPVLAKQYVIRLLLIDIYVSGSVIQSWTKPDAQTQQSHRLAMFRLRELRILNEQTSDDKKTVQQNIQKTDKQKLVSNKEYILNNNFQRCLRQALFTHITDPTLDTTTDTNNSNNQTDKRLSVEQLTIYANNKWESMLHYMVGASTQQNLVTPDIQQRLIDMGLMELQINTTGIGKNYKRTEQYVITSVGFNFLFKDQATQVWDIILAYIDTVAVHNNNANRYEILQFLFRLSFLRVGCLYDTTTLTETQKQLLIDLSSFGLVFMNKATSKQYSPTPLALTLSNTPTVQSQTQLNNNNIQQNGFIIVETTFKVYAFTTSPFHIKLLSLFVRLDYRLPNMIVGTITKQSIRHALKNNITSTEIMNYLDAYAHPQMRTQLPILPPTVVDQIRLWEHERDRLDRTPAVLFDEFDISTNEFQQTIAEVKKYDPKHILLINNEKKLLVMTPGGLDIVKAWRQKQKQQKEAAAAAANG